MTELGQLRGQRGWCYSFSRGCSGPITWRLAVNQATGGHDIGRWVRTGLWGQPVWLES